MIKYLQFNSTDELSDIRSVLSRIGLFWRRHLSLRGQLWKLGIQDMDLESMEESELRKIWVQVGDIIKEYKKTDEYTIVLEIENKKIKWED